MADNKRQDMDGVTELLPFDRDKLFISLYESLRHRQAAATDARGLCDTVVAYIIAKAADSRITARDIRDITLNTLRRFDEAAAMHYAAFHP